MRYLLLASLSLLLSGCGGDGDSSSVDSVSQSGDEFKKRASIVEDSDGAQFSQIEVSSTEDLIISVAKNEQDKAVFSLSSSNEDSGDIAEKLVVSGKLTIK
ncbi:hypothetical protein JCM19239_5912 [Vibrio variabilis]|uniref:Uncharacterized protein n=1 Tax=Vibrio variabilis TaxID=990271 RepID=A0ABQ0JA17_9VIBR|nr:hypothetical protein JCM19239_5912 [Vibrio variabilis]